MVCPYCGNALPSDAGDGQLIVCLGCAAHLRRRGEALEVDAPPPGEAVPSAVERESTDRAIVAVPPGEAAKPPAIDARWTSDDPEELPPLPAPPHAPEANAPLAFTQPADDRTPAVGVPLPLVPPKSRATAPSSPPSVAPSSPPPSVAPSSPAIAGPPPRHVSRGVVIAVTAAVAAIAILVALALLR